MISLLLVALLVNAVLVVLCVRWNWDGRNKAERIAGLKTQLGRRRYSFGLCAIANWFWQRASLIGFFVIPVGVGVISMFIPDSSISDFKPLLFIWLMTPFGELCSVINRCQLLDLRIINLELELLRNVYVNQARAN